MPVYPHTFHFPMSRHSRGENPLLCFLNVPRNAFLFLQGGDFRRRDELVGKAYMMGSFQGGLPKYVATRGLYGFNKFLLKI
ncbi:hypothetical protein V6Z12_D05G327800 [Gossypium hirsutum]